MFLIIFGCSETPNDVPIDSYREVTFHVDMSNEELSENDTIAIFINSNFVEMFDENDDGIYSIMFENLILGRTYEYRFAINNTLEVLDGNNRTFTVQDENNVILDVYNELNPTTVIFKVDMNNAPFNPDEDTVDVPGNYNDWSENNPMTDEDNDGVYEIHLSTIEIGYDLEYKFRINFDWDTAEFDGGANRTHTVVQGENLLSHTYDQP